jgi:hypothetical protein
MDCPFRLQDTLQHNQFSHRNYPISVGFNKAEDKYAFGGWSDAVFTSN